MKFSRQETASLLGNVKRAAGPRCALACGSSEVGCYADAPLAWA